MAKTHTDRPLITEEDPQIDRNHCFGDMGEARGRSIATLCGVSILINDPSGQTYG